MLVKNKVILVTGAGSGIGKELALSLLERGAKIVGIDLRKESLDALIMEAKVDSKMLTTHHLDITDRAAVEKLPEKIILEHGSIDGIINNAGIIQPFVRVNDLSYEAIEKVMNVNFFGMLYMTKTFLPFLLKRPEAHIVNISSMGGFLPVPGQSVYGASKAAVKLFTEGLYAELSDTNVRVSVVFPGATKTNIAENSGASIIEQPKEKSQSQNFPMLSANEAAKIIIDGIEKDKFQIFTGKDSNFMNILCRLNPKFATNFIAKKMKSLLPK